MSSSSDREIYQRFKKAVTSGDITTLKRLIKGGVCINDQKADFWFEGTLLHEAVAIGKEEVVQLLLQTKPNVNAKDKSGQTALHLACRSARVDLVQHLINHGAHVNAITKTGRSCLHVATWQGHTDIAKTLLQKGAARSINTKDEDGWTPVHWAAKVNLLTVLQMMINRGANVNVTDKRGQTPLHLALLSHGDVAMVRTLLYAGADPNNTQRTGSLSVFLKLKHCTPAAVDLLLQFDYSLHTDKTLYNNVLNSQLQKNHKDLYDILTGHRQSLPKLTHLCRYCIRKRLNEVNLIQNLSRTVHKLPLPELLQDFVMFNHLKDNT